MDQLPMTPHPGLQVVRGGLFISNGKGTHPDRILNDHELIVVRKGTLSIWEDDVRFDVPPGHALLLFSGRRHRGAAPFGRNLSFYWIHFTTDKRRSRPLLSIPQFVRVPRADCVAELFHRYLDDQESERLTPLYSALLVLQILCEVARAPEVPDVQGAVLAGRAEAYVSGHLAEKLSTARIARALRVNPDYLNRTFHKVRHMTMTEHIHRRRLADAVAMLRETTDTIAEIAGACGYLQPGHFRRMFQRYHGLSPAAYRRLMARAFVNVR
jgi:AraC-like DNA-binding protein